MTDSAGDERAAQAVMVTYTSSIDDRAWAPFRALFLDDVELVGFGAKPIDGADAWLSFVQGVIGNYRATQHLIGAPRVEIDGDRARLRTPLQALHWPNEAGEKVFSLWGTYRTELARTPEGWRIARHQLDTQATRFEDWGD